MCFQPELPLQNFIYFLCLGLYVIFFTLPDCTFFDKFSSLFTLLSFFDSLTIKFNSLYDVM